MCTEISRNLSEFPQGRNQPADFLLGVVMHQAYPDNAILRVLNTQGLHTATRIKVPVENRNLLFYKLFDSSTRRHALHGYGDRCRPQPGQGLILANDSGTGDGLDGFQNSIGLRGFVFGEQGKHLFGYIMKAG